MSDNPITPQGWQDIATAPKDGTLILAQWPYYCTQSWFETKWCPAEPGGDPAGWWAEGWGWMLDGREPVRWMPLPPAPGESA